MIKQIGRWLVEVDHNFGPDGGLIVELTDTTPIPPRSRNKKAHSACFLLGKDEVTPFIEALREEWKDA